MSCSSASTTATLRGRPCSGSCRPAASRSCAHARSTRFTSRSGSTTPTTTGRTTRAEPGRTASYNAQAGVLDVTDNRWIDAPSVEKRPIDTAPPGVDTRKPTIFFINWYGRSDFRFHVYAKTGEPDPDTGYALVANRVAADILRDRDRRKAERDLEAADRSLRRAQDVLEDHDYNAMLSHAASAYRSVRTGAAKAGVKVRVRQPSTWTVAGAPRGSRMAPGAIDLGPAQNRKRGIG